MAAPPDVTLAQLEGKFILNKKLSDPIDAILALQGISWPLRKAAALATPTLSIRSSERPEDKVVCITITSVVNSALLPSGGSTEQVALDWSTWEKKDVLLGSYRGKTGWCTPADLAAEEGQGATFLQGMGREEGGWCEEEGGKHIRMLLESSKDGGWSAEYVWGFEVVAGQRRYTRRLVGNKGERTETARLVYDYLGTV